MTKRQNDKTTKRYSVKPTTDPLTHSRVTHTHAHALSLTSPHPLAHPLSNSPRPLDPQHGLSPSTKVFSLVGWYPDLKAALEARGWVQVVCQAQSPLVVHTHA